MSEKNTEYQILRGFNVTGEDGAEKRFDIGPTAKPAIVRPGDFTEKQWKALLSLKAVEPVKEPVDRLNQSPARN